MKKEEIKKAEEKAGVKAVVVLNAKGEYVRTYSAEAHGERFVALAQGFAEKIGGSLRKE